MAKADFEFYSIPDIDGEFVVPAMVNDPYRHQFDPRAAADFALDTILEPVEEVAGEEVAVVTQPAQEDLTRQYFFKQISPIADVIKQQVKIILPNIDHKHKFESRPVFELFRSLAVDVQEFHVGNGEDTPADDSIKVRRETGGMWCGARLVDLDGSPRHPSINLDQLTLIRVFKWLPGPSRRGKNGLLPPTFSPRPVQLAVAQAVEIVACNSEAGPIYTGQP